MAHDRKIRRRFSRPAVHVEKRPRVGGSFPAMSREDYLAWRDSIAVSDKPSDTVVEMKDGRVFEIHHRPMPDRGWVATHEDITESHRAQKALAAAKAGAERAEREARAAHATLVDALDLIPEGLAVFDASMMSIERSPAKRTSPRPSSSTS